MKLLITLFIVLLIPSIGVAGDRSDYYFSASGMAVFMNDDSFGFRDAGAPRGNQWVLKKRHPENAQIIPSLEQMLEGKERKMERGDTGIGATMAVGKRLGKNLRGEIELGYRQGGFENLVILTPSEQLRFEPGNGADNWADPVNEHDPRGKNFEVMDGGFKTRSLLANLIFDIPLTEHFSPYVGAGFGLHWTILNNGSVETGGTGLAYQLMAGLNYKATDKLELFGGYRYFSADAVQMYDQLKVEVDTQNIELGLRYYLDAPKKKVVSERPDSHTPNPFYVGISGGLVQNQDTSSIERVDHFNGVAIDNHQWKAGYGLEVVAGYRLSSMFRAELEYSYKFSTLASRTLTHPPSRDIADLEPELGHSAGDISNRSVIHAVLINLYADLNIADIKEKYGILPFLGFGFGGMFVDHQIPRTDQKGWGSLDLDNRSFAVQLAAGVGYSLTDHITVGTQYKYLTMVGNDELTADENIKVQSQAPEHAANNGPYLIINVAVHSYGLFARYDF